MDKWDLVPHYLLFCLVANMSQIRDKKAHRKGIETENPINAKSVQLIELHAPPQNQHPEHYHSYCCSDRHCY